MEPCVVPSRKVLKHPAAAVEVQDGGPEHGVAGHPCVGDEEARRQTSLTQPTRQVAAR
eukprot:gene16634-38049_t